jgi:mannose-1-phosphate guanylyltransferase
MIPVGPRRKPLLEYVVRLLVYHDIRSITMLNGYRAEEIENYFGNGSRFGAEINYSRDPKHANGSAGALSNAVRSGKISNFDALIVYYGDILSNINLGQLVGEHSSKQADATLVLSSGFSLPVGVAKVQDGIVETLTEKPTLDISVTTGNMVLSKKATPVLKEVASKIEASDLMRDFVPLLLKRGRRVGAFYTKDFWYDIGTVEKYQNLSDRLVEKHLSFLEEQ